MAGIRGEVGRSFRKRKTAAPRRRGAPAGAPAERPRYLLVNFSESPENFHLEQAFIRHFNDAGDGALDVLHHFVQSEYAFLEPVPNRTGRRLVCSRKERGADALPRSGYEAVFFIDYPTRMPPFLEFVRVAKERRAKRSVMIINHLLPMDWQTRCVDLVKQMKLFGLMDVVFLFDFEARAHCTALGTREESIRMRTYGIDCRYYRPLPIPEQGYIFSAGSAGRDYGLLAEAAAGRDVMILSDSPGENVEQRAAAAGCRLRLMRLDRNIDNLRNAIGAASLVVAPVMPHFLNETAGMAVAYMGMGMGKAVIARDTPYMRRYVTHGEDGLLYRPGDAADLRLQLETLANDPGLRKRLGKRAITTVRAKASLDRMVEDFLAEVRAS